MAKIISFPVDRCAKGTSVLRDGAVVSLPLMQDLSTKEMEFVRRAAAILAQATCVHSGENLGSAQAFARAMYLVEQARQA